MKRFVCFVFSVLVGWMVFADNIQRISTEYTYLSDNSHETPEQAEQTALLRAKQQALEEHFGIEVSSVQSVLQHSRMENGGASDATDLFALKETAPRGEWIETVKERVISRTFQDGFWQVRVYVEGKARSLAVQKADIRYAFINNVHDREMRMLFHDGDDLFLRFSSPVDGALCVYLVDEEQNAYCLLPYQNVGAGFQPVRANNDYLFFSADAEPADEYVLTCQRTVEQNVLFVVFSPNRFTKANDRQGGVNWREEQLPRQLPYSEFIQWLTRNQTRDRDMVVRKEIISIKR